MLEHVSMKGAFEFDSIDRGAVGPVTSILEAFIRLLEEEEFEPGKENLEEWILMLIGAQGILDDLRKKLKELDKEWIPMRGELCRYEEEERTRRINAASEPTRRK